VKGSTTRAQYDAAMGDKGRDVLREASTVNIEASHVLVGFRVLGVRVHAVQIPQVVVLLENWIAERSRSRYVAVTGMHGVMEAQRDTSFREILNTADCVVPDGMPLVWLGRWQGFALKRRVYGPELLETLCQTTGTKYRHFFYGGIAGVAGRLADSLEQLYGIQIAGTYSPPFRLLTEEEDREIVAMIRASAPDILWVGLSTPKQERWMYAHRSGLGVPVMVGVGAAFDIHSGRKKRAPRWMQEHGLEWMFRLFQEPRRLWRRYLVYGPEFAALVLLELLGLKKIR
jgi:N-acetylglucosaminyldiphosphoundecaprenol N-acetyl-beta-D-mannosaminyltransferase